LAVETLQLTHSVRLMIDSTHPIGS